MPRSEYFQAASLRIEAQREGDQWLFTAWRPHVSQGFTDSRSLLRWAKWPIKTPTGDALRLWLAALESAPPPAPEAIDG